ncbi:MAG TPA: hypothetical protein VGD78_10435 [Chthoniobacterales bacterium]
MRTSTELACPGRRDNYVVIVDGPDWKVKWGIGNPANTGNCALFLSGLDSGSNPVNASSDLRLNPGDNTHWYWPPAGSVQIVAVCSNDCNVSGSAVLEYDTPDA